MAFFFLALWARRACILALRSALSALGTSYLALTTGAAAGLTATAFLGATILVV